MRVRTGSQSFDRSSWVVYAVLAAVGALCAVALLATPLVSPYWWQIVKHITFTSKSESVVTEQPHTVPVPFVIQPATQKKDEIAETRSLPVKNVSNMESSAAKKTPAAPASASPSLEKANGTPQKQAPGEPFVIPSTPVPLAPEPSVVMNSRFGFAVADEFSVASDQELTKVLDIMAHMGVGWVRIDVDWSVIQARGPNEYNWAPIDRTVREATVRGIKVLPILAYTPRWARAADCSSNKCPPQDPGAFARFARATAERYAPRGVHTWEIWNEPNTRKFFYPNANVGLYAEMLVRSADAIRSVDKNAFIVSGGLAPKATEGGNIAPLEFLEGLYTAGAQQSFDAVGFHPYSFPLTPDYFAKTNAWSQMELTGTSIRSIMQSYGDGDKKVWLTEYGAPTDGSRDMATPENYSRIQGSDHVTEELQATMLSQAVHKTADYPWAGPLFWYSYKDIGESQSTNENFFGVVRFDGESKQSFNTLQILLKTGILR